MSACLANMHRKVRVLSLVFICILTACQGSNSSSGAGSSTLGDSTTSAGPSTSTQTVRYTASSSQLPADGTSQFELQVDIYEEDKKVSPQNVVVDISVGSIAVTQNAEGSYIATITSPTTVSEGVVSVTVGGVKLAQIFEVDFVVLGSGFVLASVGDQTVIEGNGASGQQFGLVVTLNELLSAAANVQVDYISGTAITGSDIPVYSQTLTLVTGSLSQSINLPIVGDTFYEANEFFYIDFSSPSANLGLSKNRIRIDILNDDTRSLNDTGVGFCRSSSAQNAACNNAAAGTDLYANQDGDLGRDVSSNSSSDGKLGFSYEKIDSAGVALTDQTKSYADTPWSCVSDKVTGLLWEVKASSSGLHSNSDTYTWLELDALLNGGSAGNNGNKNTCFSYDSSVESSYCNTHAFIKRVNQNSLCGRNNWRLPTINELMSIVDLGVTSGPSIDADYFPNVQSQQHWTGTPVLGLDSKSRTVDFDKAKDSVATRDNSLSVRLVSDSGS